MDELITLKFTREGIQGLIALINENDTRSRGDSRHRVFVSLEEDSQGGHTLAFRIEEQARPIWYAIDKVYEFAESLAGQHSRDAGFDRGMIHAGGLLLELLDKYDNSE